MLQHTTNHITNSLNPEENKKKQSIVINLKTMMY